MKYYDDKPKTPEYKPEKPQHSRTALRTIQLTLVYHAVTWLFYTIFISNTVEVWMMRDEMIAAARWTMFGYGAVSLLIIATVMAVFYIKDAERKRAYLTATSVEIRGAENVSEGFSRYRKLALTEGVVCTAAAGGLWMIPAIFYTISLSTAGIGIGYAGAWGLEQFFGSFMGLCEPFQNPWMGMLIGLGVVFGFNYGARVYAHKTWAANRIRK